MTAEYVLNSVIGSFIADNLIEETLSLSSSSDSPVKPFCLMVGQLVEVVTLSFHSDLELLINDSFILFDYSLQFGYFTIRQSHLQYR